MYIEIIYLHIVVYLVWINNVKYKNEEITLLNVLCVWSGVYVYGVRNTDRLGTTRRIQKQRKCAFGEERRESVDSNSDPTKSDLEVLSGTKKGLCLVPRERDRERGADKRSATRCGTIRS